MTSSILVLRPDIKAAAPVGTRLLTPSGHFDSGVYVPFNDEPMFNAGEVRGMVNGNAVVAFVAPSFDAVLGDDGQLSTFFTSIGLSGAVTLEFRIDVEGELAGALPLLRVPLPVLDFGDVVITPHASVKLRYSGHAAAGACVSVVVPFAGGARFGKPGVTDLDDPTLKAEIGIPQVTAAANFAIEVEVVLVFLVTVNGVSVGGPVFSTSLGIELHVNVLPISSWSADSTLEFRGGWALILDELVLDGSLKKSSTRFTSDPLAQSLLSSRWSRVYDNGSHQTSAGFVCDDRGIVLMGNSGLGVQPWLSQIDVSGAPTWQQVSQPSNDMNVKSLIRLSSGDLLATGGTGPGGGMRVERYGADGKAVWAMVMSGPQSSQLAWGASAATPRDGAVLAGQISYPSGESRCVFAEIDAQGTVRWMTDVGLDAAAAPRVDAVAITSTEQILAVGTIAVDDGTSSSDSEAVPRAKRAFILRLSPDGTALKAFALGGPKPDRATALVVLDDDSYAVGGSTTHGFSSEVPNWAWITRFDAADTYRWSCTYAGENTGAQGRVNAMASLDDGGLVVVAGFGTLEETVDAWLFRVDASGTPLWFKSFDGPGNDTLTHVKTLKDGMLAFGYTRSIKSSTSRPGKLWVVRTSVDGMLAFNATSGMRARNDALRFQRSVMAVRTLTPANFPGTLTLSVASSGVAPGNSTNELLTQ